MNADFVKSHAGELRYRTFVESFRLAEQIGVKCIIETGTWRGLLPDGQSTLLLSTLAQELGADFYSVDINPTHVDRSREKMKELKISNVRHACCDSVFFLSLFTSPIQFLYLDSYDYSETTPEPSQLHQVAEIGAAWGKMINKVIVLLDDCDVKGGGKGLLATRFLTERGYKLHMSAYQNLFINF